jgi:multisubunit Na+/H+ antiporter MnhB subunit
MAERAGWARRGGAALVLAPLAGLLVAAVLALPPEPAALAGEVRGALHRSGVSHPVTAVLLDFRGYDIWLELGVLLAAVAALLSLRREHDLRSLPAASAPDPVLAGATATVVPVMVLAAGYLLWLGSHAPGGAFQAGAVLGSAGILLLLAGRRSVAALPAPSLRAAAAAGFLAFLAAGGGAALAGGAFLQHPPRVAGLVILGVEAAASLSIAVALAALFAGARAPEEGG